MTELPALTVLPAMLSADEVINAVAVLFAERETGKRLALKDIEPLVRQPEKTWPAQLDPLTRSQRVVAYLAGAELTPLLELAGDLALVRQDSGGFLLLRQRDGRWFFISGEGVETAEFPVLPDGVTLTETTTSVLLLLPSEKTELLDAFESLRRVMKPAWAEVGLASVIINFSLLMTPIFAMLVYDKVVYNGVFSTLWVLTIGMILFLALDFSLRSVRTWAVERLVTEFTQRDDAAIWRALRNQVEPPKGGLARFLTNYRELAVAREFVSSAYLLAIADTPFMLLYLVAIAVLAWPLALVTLVIALIYAVIGFRNHRLARRYNQESEQSQIRKLGFMSEALAALDVARLTPGANLLDKRWRGLCLEAAELESRRRMNVGFNTTTTIAMSTFTMVALLVAGAYMIDARALTVGGLIAANILARQALSIESSLFTVLTRMQDFRRAVGRLESSLDIQPEASAEQTPIARPDISGHIRVLGLSKRYRHRPPALADISFAIEPGERVALLGKPGAGKSTLLRCLAHFIKNDSGQILIDGVNIRDIGREDMRRWMAFKAQEPALFAGTLDENLRVAFPGGVITSETQRQRLEQALWASGLEEEFSSGRMNLGMQLEDQGRNLSGGQRQKVALARALAQPSKILLLDEPSLGLDPDSEKRLAERLPQMLSAEDTLIIVSHSATMLTMTRRVIALDNGRLVADGAQDKLLRVG